MPNIQPVPLVVEVRRALDELTLEGDRSVTAAQMRETGSSNFADTDILDRMGDAARLIASQVKAQHVPDLIVQCDAAAGGLAGAQATWPPFTRLLGERVFVASGVNVGRGVRRVTRANYERMVVGRGVTPSAEHPVFVYEDGHFQAYAGVGTAVTADVVVVPLCTRLAGRSYTTVAGNASITLAVGAPLEGLDAGWATRAGVLPGSAQEPDVDGALVVLDGVGRAVLHESTATAATGAGVITLAAPPYEASPAAGPIWRYYRSAARMLPDYLADPVVMMTSAALLLAVGMEQAAALGIRRALETVAPYTRKPVAPPPLDAQPA